jgi:photosystem II stability/assembly factor-like uncharacterized protein
MTLMFAGLILPGTGAINHPGDGNGTYYAAVFLNRGHVSGGGASNIGLFRRVDDDTIWNNMYHKNLFLFGLGQWKSATSTRSYLAAGNGLHRSVDGGKSWRVLTDWQTMEALSVALDPADSSLIYIATPFGVFKSTDDGATWIKKTTGMKKWFVKKVIVDRLKNSTLYATAEDDLYKSTDKGEHWSPLHVGVPGIEAFVQSPADEKLLAVGTEDDGVRVTADGGKTWVQGNGLAKTAIYGLCASSDKRTLYAGGYKTGLWKSDDNGRSWFLLWLDPDIEAIYTIFVHPTQPNHLMVGTSGQGIYESLDAGKTWRNIGLRGCHVKEIQLYQ